MYIISFDPFDTNVLDKISYNCPFQRIKKCALIRGVGAYSGEGCLLDIPVSRVCTYSRGTYSRGMLFEALQYNTFGLARLSTGSI